MSRFRRVKKDVRAILSDPEWQSRLSELEAWPPGVVVPPLFSMRLDRDESVRWRSVVAFGLTAGRMAAASMEKARVLMRTCMWHMNEESGNLGWGIPHFMAEAMVNDERIAKEFHKILASYIFCDEACDGNFLDHVELRRDVFGDWRVWLKPDRNWWRIVNAFSLSHWMKRTRTIVPMPHVRSV